MSLGTRIAGFLTQLSGFRFIDEKVEPRSSPDPALYRVGNLLYLRNVDGSKFVLTNGGITDPGAAGAIPVTRSGVCNLTSAAAETRTLAAPTFVGQTLSLCMNADGGDIVVTVASAFNQAANTTITLNDAGDFAQLQAVNIAGALRWRLVVNDGCTLG